MLDERIYYQFRRCKVIKFAWKIFFFKKFEKYFVKDIRVVWLKVIKIIVFKIVYFSLRNHFVNF